MKTITFDDLHQLVSEVDYINEESYPIAFTVDGKKYRVGIGPYSIDDLSNIAEDCDEEEVEHYAYFPDFFSGYEDEVQYLSRIYDEDDFDAPGANEIVLDACDPDDMEFHAIGDMLKKCCNITESSKIQISTKHSFNGNQYGVWWMELSDEVIAKEKACVDEWKAELKECGYED
jgi:hypothetical protein